MKTRITGIDVFRLFAAFCVVSLHIGYFDALGVHTGTIIRLLGRWAVPFFFMVTGYFLESKAEEKYRAVKPLQRVIVIFVTSSLIFIPFNIEKMGFSDAMSYFLSSDFLFRGGHGHLWFISSMIVGLLFVLFSDSLRLKSFLPLVTILSLLLYLALGSYNPIAESGLVSIARHFSSIAFIYIGMIFYRCRRMNMKCSLGLIIFGIFLQLVEAYYLAILLDKDALEHRFLIGTLLYSLGMFGVSLNIRNENLTMISKWGKNFSLGIYIVHPYFIWIAYGLLLNILRLPKDVAQILIVPAAFCGSFIFLALTRTYFKSLFRLIDGNIENLMQIDARLMVHLNKLGVPNR